MGDEDVYVALGYLGQRVGTDVYDQGARLRKFGYTNSEVQNGYCHSACLDWARRVVRGGRITFEPSQNDKSGTPRSKEQLRAKEEAQTDRAVRMHLNFKLGNISTGTNWQRLSATLDRNYLGGKRRSFGHIDQIYREFNLNLHSIRGVVDHLTGSTGFTTNCCALLSFDYFAGGGHVVAVYQTNTSRFVLFDPNYTMFELPNIDKFYEALRYLFLDAVYPSQGKQWNGIVDIYVYSNGAGAPILAPIVQTISHSQQHTETTSALTGPTPTPSVPIATQSVATTTSTSGALQPPASGASVFKQNLWTMLNDNTRRDGAYVRVAYSQKAEIERHGTAVSPANKVSRQDLEALYRSVA